MMWFGEDWGASVCQACVQATTPVGAVCARCSGEIMDGDRGLILPGVSLNNEHFETIWHFNCFMSCVIPPEMFPEESG